MRRRWPGGDRGSFTAEYAAGLRGFSALAQAAVLLPLLLLFAWKAALAAAALALPVWWLSRRRSASLAASARAFGDSSESLARKVGAYAEGLESASGNGRLAEACDALSGAEASHEDAARRWELTKARFPPLLEWLFFAALAALLALAAPVATAAPPSPAMPAGGADWTGSLLPFAALLLLLYRPLREWARAHPARLPGDAAWSSYRTLHDTLSALPERRPHARAPGGRIVCDRIRFAYGNGSGSGTGAGRVSEKSKSHEGGSRGDAPREVFRGLRLELDPGETTWIHGPNGSGKSTLLKILAGVEFPDGGRVLLPARLSGAPAPFAFLPQRAVIEPDWPEWAERYSRERAAEWERLDAILGLAPLRERWERVRGRDSRDPRAWAEALSGGQRQRLALARVFASDAPCLLLDEPTTWLSGADRERILGGLLAFRRRRPGAGAVLVSHEPFAGAFCSRALRLDDAEPAPGGAGDGAEDPTAEAQASGTAPEPRDPAEVP